MKRLLKFSFTALVSTIFLTSISFPHAIAVDTPDEQFVIPLSPSGDRYTALYVQDNGALRNPVVKLEAKDSISHRADDEISSLVVCKQVGANGCDLDKYLQFDTVLSRCDSFNIHNCVSAVSAINDSGKKFQVDYLDKYPASQPYSYIGDIKLNLPNGGTSFLVDIPDLPHGGGTNYLVTVAMNGSKDFKETRFKITDFQAGIFAVSKLSVNCTLPGPENDWKAHGLKVMGRAHTTGGCFSPGIRTQPPCVQMDTSSCLISWPLPTEINFGLTIKLSTIVTGWLHGRVTDVEAKIETADDGDQLITVSGKPTKVPGIFAYFKKSQFPAELAKLYSQDPNGADGNGMGWNDGSNQPLVDGNPYSILKGIYNYDEGSFKEILTWINVIGDKATFSPTSWSLRTIQSGNEYSNCLKDSTKLAGIVTTNATMYIGAPPTFNKSSQTLEYKVAAPHLTSSGEVFRGTYNLAIRSEIARCIYKFTSAPVSGTISVINSDGSTTVATTALGEKNGWIYLSANGFTFSSPIIKIKLTQVSNKKLSPTSIACYRGNKIKNIKGINPKCPKGYMVKKI